MVGSDHRTFTVRSDLPVDEAQSAASSFETLFASLAEVGFASASRPNGGRTPSLTACERSFPLTEAPSPQDVLRMKPSAFDARENVDRKKEKGRAESRRAATNYAGAAALVRLLLTHPSSTSLFASYLERLHDGEPSGEALASTVGQKEADLREADYRASIDQPMTSVLRTKYSPPAVNVDPVRVMTNAQVHVLWAGLRNWTTRDLRCRAQTHRERPRLLELVRRCCAAHSPAHLGRGGLDGTGWRSSRPGAKRAAADIERRSLPTEPAGGPARVSGNDPNIVIVKCITTIQATLTNCRPLNPHPSSESVIQALLKKTYSPALDHVRPVVVEYVFRVRVTPAGIGSASAVGSARGVDAGVE